MVTVSIHAAEQSITLDELLRLRDTRVEIIEGRLVPMNAAAFQHAVVAQNLNRLLDPYVVAHGLGAVFSDGLTYLMHSDTRNLKDSFMPDLSFLRTASILVPPEYDKPYPGVPDLAIEVVSPGDDADDLMLKVRTYLAKGTEQVWVVYPVVQEVHQYRREGDPEIRIYRGNAPIDVQVFFPGLQITPSQIFQMPGWALP
jgi:Uma2 family endonuclease